MVIAMHWENRGPSRGARRAVYSLAFFTGAAGLIYEISWSRQIGLLFGHTAQAAGVVLSAYFAGMAIGYVGAGRSASRWSRPLRGYCLAEFSVAGWAVVIPALLSRFDGSVIGIGSAINSGNPPVQVLTRTALVFVVLLPATIGLGATLPFMVEFLVPCRDERASGANTTYAMNTAGGVAGVASATAVLLVVMGVRGSAYLAAAITFLCGVLGWMIDAAADSKAAVTSRELHEASGQVPLDGTGGSGRFQWLILGAVSGFGVLALEVLYNRLFALVLHNSTYTFGLVLMVCLFALATGAALARHVGDALGPRSAGYICVLVSATIPMSVIGFNAVTGLRYFTFGDSLGAYLAGALGLVMLVVFPPVALAGMLLPTAWRGEWGKSAASRVIGGLTGVNTIGGCVGALVASFVALPWLGLWGAFALIAILYLVAALAMARTQGRSAVRIAAFLVVLIVVLGLWVPKTVRVLESTQTLVRHWDSSYGWVDVLGDWAAGDLLIARDVHHFIGSTKNSAQEKWQADLPLFLHARPARTLFIGLGTGITAGEALTHPEVEHLTVVELIPEVVDAARLFVSFNENLLEDPRVIVVVNDGRHFLMNTEKSFDVIVADLFVPWESQTGYLYTVEHYQAARKRLKPSGLYCQWLPTWQVREKELLMIVDSFATVFPHVSLWFGNTHPGFVPVALMGSDQPITGDGSDLAHKMSRAGGGRSHSESSPSSAEVASLYVGEWQRSTSNRLNTDEHPRVEFLAPNAHFNKDEQLVFRARVLQALGPRLAGTAVNIHDASR